MQWLGSKVQPLCTAAARLLTFNLLFVMRTVLRFFCTGKGAQLASATAAVHMARYIKCAKKRSASPLVLAAASTFVALVLPASEPLPTAYIARDSNTYRHAENGKTPVWSDIEKPQDILSPLKVQ